MTEKPKAIYILVLLWLAISGIFVMWGAYSLTIVLQIPDWTDLSPWVQSTLHVSFLMSTIVWFVFSSLFIIFSYGTFKKDHWVWTTGVIISTIFLAVFGLMLASFMINAVVFLDWFSIGGLISVVLSFLIDLGIVFFLTRPIVKAYFEV